MEKQDGKAGKQESKEADGQSGDRVSASTSTRQKIVCFHAVNELTKIKAQLI
ncbi:MAG: hypothetical protein Q4D19_06460 [Lautropia sp.]|nr:hypothetical protein [Lautropia sp.]